MHSVLLASEKSSSEFASEKSSSEFGENSACEVLHF